LEIRRIVATAAAWPIFLELDAALDKLLDPDVADRADLLHTFRRSLLLLLVKQGGWRPKKNPGSIRIGRKRLAAKVTDCVALLRQEIEDSNHGILVGSSLAKDVARMERAWPGRWLIQMDSDGLIRSIQLV
jgi:hypothetical protein